MRARILYFFFKQKSPLLKKCLSVRHLNLFSENQHGNCIDVRKNSSRISPKKTSVSPPNIPLTISITLYHKKVLKKLGLILNPLILFRRIFYNYLFSFGLMYINDD